MQNQQNTQNNCYNTINTLCDYTKGYLKAINPFTHVSSFFGVKPDNINEFEAANKAFEGLDNNSNLRIKIEDNAITINGYKFEKSLLNEGFFNRISEAAHNIMPDNGQLEFTEKTNEDMSKIITEYLTYCSIKNSLSKIEQYNKNEHIGNYDQIVPDIIGTILAPMLSYFKALKIPLSYVSIAGSSINILEYFNGLVFNNKKDHLFQELMPDLAPKLKESHNNIKSHKVGKVVLKTLSNLVTMSGYIMSLAGYKGEEEKSCLSEYTNKYSSEVADKICDGDIDIPSVLKMVGAFASTAIFFISLYGKIKVNDNEELNSNEKYNIALDIENYAKNIVDTLNKYSNAQSTAEEIYNTLAKSVFGQFGLGSAYPNKSQEERSRNAENPNIRSSAQLLGHGLAM